MSIERSIRMAACLVTLAGASAFAQTTKPDEAPLRGPSGNDHSVPGETGRFGGGASGDKKDRAAQQPIRHPMFMKALDVLRGEQADASVRLTSDQDAKIKTIDEAFRKQAETFRTEHAAEVRGLVSQLTPEDRRKFAQYMGLFGGRDGAGERAKGDGAKGGGVKGGGKAARRPDATPQDGNDAMTDAKPDPAAAEAARNKLREIVEAAPKPEETHKQIFGVLTDTQRPVVEKEIERMRQEMEKKAQEGGKQLDRAAQREGRKLDNKNQDQANAGAPTSIDDPRIPEKARERLKSLPADQQQAALRRMWERLQNQKK